MRETVNGPAPSKGCPRNRGTHMSTLFAFIAQPGRTGLAGRRAQAFAVSLLAAGALAAGCGATQSSAPAGSPSHATGPAAPSTSAAPGPTGSGGPGPAGAGAR